MKRIGTFLIAVALMAGMVGCGDSNGNGNGAVSYQLTVSSTSGGSVVEPGEGVHIYEEGTVVELEAVADDGYRFVNWTGDVGAVANVNAESTTVTMNENYSITASFVAVYDLSISSTDGGSVTTPGEGTFTYDD
ncbi:MAG: InlB B-repeat-containing protein, partial [Dehalococcoidia bacterium]